MFQKIKDVRIAKGMSQVELAKASGVSRGTIIGLESGKITNTQTDTIRQIAKALGCPVDTLFFDESV